MSVIRVIHDHQNPFVMINRRSLWDPDLSFEATGMWARLLSKPDNWSIYCSQLSLETNVGIDTIRRIMKQLINAGYVHRIRSKDGRGQYKRVDYYVFESKKTAEEIQKMFPQCKNPRVENTPPNNIDLENDIKRKKDKERAAPFQPPTSSPKKKKTKEPKSELAQGIWLTDTQAKNIVERLGGDSALAAKAYDKLSVWKISKSIEGGNDYRSLLNWVLNAVKEDEAKPKKIDRAPSHRAAAEKVKSEHPNNPNIVLGHNYIEFKLGRMGVPDPHLVFGENGFDEQLQNNLMKVLMQDNPANAPNSSLNAPKIDSNAKPVSFVEKKKQSIFGHKETAEMWNGLKWNGMKVTALENEVQLSDQSGIRTVKYSVSNEEWKSQTGWD